MYKKLAEESDVENQQVRFHEQVGGISPQLLGPLVSEDLKSFDMEFFYAIRGEFPDVMTMARCQHRPQNRLPRL
jgi:hypothetical protein